MHCAVRDDQRKQDATQKLMAKKPPRLRPSGTNANGDLRTTLPFILPLHS